MLACLQNILFKVSVCYYLLESVGEWRTDWK